jgi:hypothetical protein
MPTANPQDSSILTLIVAMFDAAPGHEVLNELRAALDAGESLENLSRNLVNTEAFHSLYAPTLSRQEFAGKFSARILGENAGLTQLLYATEELTRLQDAGMDRSQMIGFAIRALLAVDPANAEWGCVRRAFDNKIIVAGHFSIERGKSAQTLAELQTPVSQVDSSNHSRESAIRVIDGLAPLPARHITGLADTALHENTAFATIVSASDTADAVTWALAGEDALQFRLDTVSGLLYLAARDFEAPTDRDADNVYHVEVHMIDSCGKRLSQSLSVSILDIAEALKLTISVHENTAFNASVAVATAGTTVRWSVEGEDAARFSIDAHSGALAMVPRNFEVPVDADGDNVYAVTVRATDAQGSSATQLVAVNVLDVVEVASVTMSGLVDVSVAENTAFSATLGVAGAIGTVSWSLEGADARHFSLSSSGRLSMVGKDFEAPADADADNLYTLSVRATDADGNTTIQSASIKVSDRNEAPFAITTSPPSLRENIEPGTPIASLYTQDSDAGDTFTYSLVAGAGDTDNAAFTLSGNQLLIARSPDFETQPAYSLRVRSIDQGGLSVEQRLHVSVQDQLLRPHTLALDPADDSGAASDGLTRHTSGLTITGKADAGATVVLFADADGAATRLGSTRAEIDTGAFQLDVSLAPGSHRISAREIDAAGNTGAASDPLLLQIDNAAPSVSMDMIGTDDAINLEVADEIKLGLFNITGEADADATVQLQLGAAGTRTVTRTDRFWEYSLRQKDLDDMGHGAHTLTVTATDAADNASNASRTLTIDTTPPAAPTGLALAMEDDSGLRNDDAITMRDAALTLSVSAETGTRVDLYLDDLFETTMTEGAAGRYSAELALPHGEYDITTRATDAVGNISNSAAALRLTIDTHAPQAPTVNAIANDDVLDATEQRSVVTGTAEAWTRVTLGLGSDTTRTVTADADGQWSYPLQAADVAALAQAAVPIAGTAGQGRVRISASATDTAGNDSAAPPAERMLRIDTVTPLIFPVAEDNSINAMEQTSVIRGAAEAHASVKLTLGRVRVSGEWQDNVQSLTAGADGQWTYTLTSVDIAAMDQGEETISVTSVGVRGTGNAMRHISIDTLAPEAPGIDAVSTDNIVNASEASVTLGGRVETATQVTLVLGSITRQVTAAADQWRYTLTSDDIAAIGDGAHSITAQATDAAGNVGDVSTRRITIDTVAPAAPTNLRLATEDDSGDDTSDGVTRHTAALTLSGNADAQTIVVLYAGADEVGRTTANASGSFTVDVTLGEGLHTISATATDAAGNTSADSVVNYQPVSLSVTTARSSIDENTAADDDAAIVVTAASLVVPDGGSPAGLVTWTLEPVGATDDTGRFVVNPATGEVRLQPQDREDQDPTADDHYSVRLVAADSARPAQTVGREVSVEVTNVYEFRFLEVVESPSDGRSFALELELAEGTTITVPLSVTGDPQGKLNWLLLSPSTWNNQSPASVDEATGLLTVTAPSYEESAAWAPNSGMVDGLMAAGFFLVSDSEEAGANLAIYVIGIRITDVVEPRDFTITHLLPVYTAQEARSSGQQSVLTISKNQTVAVAGDLAPVGKLTWSVPTHSPALQLIVDKSSIELVTALGLDREAYLDADGHSTATATVRAEDEDGNFAEYLITLNIEDRPEPTRLEIALPDALQGAGPHGVDEDRAHEFQLTGGPAAGQPAMQGRAIWSLSAVEGRSIEGFSIDQTGRLSLVSQDFESLGAGNNTRSVRVTLSDQDGTPNTVFTDIVLSIRDLPETGRGLALPALAAPGLEPQGLALPSPWEYGLYL